MMYYNDELLEGIPPEGKELAEIIIFCIYRRIDYRKYFDLNENSIKFDTSLPNKVNEIVKTLLENKIVDATYPEGVYRLELVKPLQVTEKVSDIQFNKIRALWSNSNINKVGWMGDPKVGKEIFDKWRVNHPTVSYEQIYKACKEYIENTEMPHKFINFLYKEGEGSHLSSVIEDVKQEHARSQSKFF